MWRSIAIAVRRGLSSGLNYSKKTPPDRREYFRLRHIARRTNKGSRGCTTCGRPGHNRRTCADSNTVSNH